VYLTNATMETYFQAGNQNASGQQEGNPPSTVQVFGTESCMGCHSSAGVAQSGTPQQPVYGGQLSADFSWLLEMKAQ
jgi:mono/diheme cytochrome c family protein